MARMKVILSGKTIYDLPVEVGQEYLIGRKESCHIRIDGDHRISREHAQLFHNGEKWLVQVLSKYGKIEYNGSEFSELELFHSSSFEIGGYRFEFYETDSSHEKNQLMTTDQGSNFENQIDSTSDSPPDLQDENTIIGALHVVPLLRIFKENELFQVIRLEGKSIWLAGRESQCEVYLPDHRISRRQFEIQIDKGVVQIIDLNSSNGTKLNGQLISSTDYTQLRSGDQIQIVDFNIKFELQDMHYQSRVLAVNESAHSEINTDDVSDESESEEYFDGQQNQQQYLPPPSNQPEAKKKSQLEKMRPLLIGIAAIALLFVFLNDDQKTNEKPKKAENLGIKKPEDPKAALFAKLKPEDQQKVKELYKQAKNNYMQGKYDQALIAINKIFDVIEDYEDIKQLQLLCREALALQEERQRQEDLERAKKEAEEKILAQVKLCEKLLKPDVDLQKIEECIATVIQFNPDHPLFNQLRTKAQEIIEKRLAELARKKAYQNDVAQLKKIYKDAEKVHARGQLLSAIPMYDKVIKSNLPDPGGLKSSAKYKISEIRQVIAEKLKKYFTEADRLAGEQKLKQAILVLRDSLKIDPGNKETQERIDNYVFELKKQMMVYYQEGILEESYGNVDGSEGRSGAKAKWKKIIDIDVPDGEYYKKAYIKLKKYGAL